MMVNKTTIKYVTMTFQVPGHGAFYELNYIAHLLNETKHFC